MNKEKKPQKEIIDEKMREPEQWEEVESPTFFKFKNVGDTISGLLIEKGTSNRYGFGIYTIKKFDGTIQRCHGSTQLDDLMLNRTVPSYVKIEFIDTEDLPSGEMKIFKVSEGRNK